MGKKIIICFVLFHLTGQMNAQFFRGAGFFIGATTASDRYRNLNPVNSVDYSHALPAPSHRSGELPGFSVGMFVGKQNLNTVRKAVSKILRCILEQESE
jgi:hypothetical protein